jgi:hypothetical protein
MRRLRQRLRRPDEDAEDEQRRLQREQMQKAMQQMCKVGMCMCAAELPIWQLGLLSWRYGNLAFRRSWQCPVGTEGAPTYRICIRTQKKSRKKQPVVPPDAPPYREAISGRKQELDQEATPGRRNFFYMSIRSKPKQALAAVRLGYAIPNCFC